MTPETAEPFDVALHHWITGQEAKRSADVIPAHLLHAPEQIAGVIEHDPRIAAGVDQLRDQIRHAAVALRKGFGVVVIPLIGVIEHVLQMRDQLAVATRRNGGLVHVQSTGESRADVGGVQVAVITPQRAVAAPCGLELRFAAGDGGQVHGVIPVVKVVLLWLVQDCRR